MPLPPFGQADLSNCEREQIHLAGSIQPHGALLMVRESDRIVVQASDNADRFLQLDDSVLDRPLDRIAGNLSARIVPHLDEPLHTIPRAIRCRIGGSATEYDGLLHRPPGGGLIIELERAGPSVDLSRHVEGSLRTIQSAVTLRALCDETARIFKNLTGYDRVMVYRFDDKGHGEVFSEQREAGLEAFLGNRYPASDIPQIARRLYIQNRIRVLVDVDYTPVPLTPRRSPLTDRELDMSLCFLRSMSPIHIQYLKNMGVNATLVVSLVVGGKLWGLIACHHYAPRFIHYEVRAVCELLAEAIATRIAALESFVRAQAELSVRRLEQRMIEAISRDGDWRGALFDDARALLQPLEATGAALLFEGQALSTGEVPGTLQLRKIGAWLDRQPRKPVVATDSLGIDVPEFVDLAGVASGLLATPVSDSPGEYLLWFRPEQVRTITWGGNPFKPVQVGDDPAELSPRRSFAQWHQLVEGTSEPWNLAQLTAARLIGESVSDVVLQFRSVQMLIAQDQLARIRQQVSESGQPVIVSDAGGRILLINGACGRLLSTPLSGPRQLDELPALFTEANSVRRNLRELLRHWRPWRGEIALSGDAAQPRPLLVRADPVFSSPNRVLGFVLLFTDLREQKEAESARRRFQEDIIERHRITPSRLESRADLLYRNLLSSVVSNAQLAALEITDGVDLSRMPIMLDSVQHSVTRSAELLEHLIWHASRAANDGDDSGH